MHFCKQQHGVSRPYEGVTTDPRKVSATKDWPTPKNIRRLRGFLGLSCYYKQFVRHYGQINRPFTNLLKKEAYLWNEQTQAAFDQLKQLLSNPSILALPDFSQPFVVETYESGDGTRAVLMQNG